MGGGRRGGLCVIELARFRWFVTGIRGLVYYFAGFYVRCEYGRFVLFYFCGAVRVFLFFWGGFPT
jgi:hypothetical protein